jgi:glycosyltransferase involved in cell wall biosynthesis
MYFLRLGFLDGWEGLTYCRLLSIYEYFIVLKMQELEGKAQGVSEVTPLESIEPMASVGTTKTIFINRYFFPDHSATSQLLSDLTFDLAARSQDVHVITSGQLYTDPGASLLSEEVICGVKVHRIHTSRFGRTRLWGRMLDYLTFYCGATWRLLRLIKPGDVVVAKTDPPMMSVCAAWAARLKKGILINWVQDLFPEVATSLDIPGIRYVAPIFKRLRNDSLKQGRSNVVLGALMAQRLRDENIPSDRITVIENWADGDVIQPVSKQDNPLLREWRLEDKFVLGYSGNMGHVHEFKTMIDAADRLKDVTEIAFVFIGAGIARHWLETEVADRGLRNVQFQPYQPDDRLRWSLAVPDVHFVSLRPTLEGLIVPSKFYGIAAAGRPVIHIGDPDGEIAGILEREQCGWNFCIGEVGPLTQCILRLFQKRHEVVEAGQRARRAFERHYSRTQALNAWRELLDSVGVPVLVVSNAEKGTAQNISVAAGKE